MAAAGFLSHYLNGPLPYNCKYNVLSASLNKTFPSFLHSYGSGLVVIVCFCLVFLTGFL